MEFRRLGNTGLKVSEISLGTWITFGEQIKDAEAKKIFEAAFDSGINYIDTADVYAAGRAEELLGRLFKGMRRDSYVLATKCGHPMGSHPTQRGLSRKHIIEACEASLKRLGLDHVDIYHCHTTDDSTPFEETCRAMDDLCRQGKVLYWGTSNFSAEQIKKCWQIADKNTWNRPVVNQPCYNMIDRHIEEEIIPVSEKLGISQVAYSPLKQGVLTGKYSRKDIDKDIRRNVKEFKGVDWFEASFSERNIRAAEKIGEIAAELSVAPSNLALAWCLRHNSVASVIMGASRHGQLLENVKASGLKLEEDVLERIKNILEA